MEGCREEEKERDRAGATDRHLRSHALALKLQRFLVLFLCCALRAFCVFLFPAYRSSVHAHIGDIDDHLHHVHEDRGKDHSSRGAVCYSFVEHCRIKQLNLKEYQ